LRTAAPAHPGPANAFAGVGTVTVVCGVTDVASQEQAPDADYLAWGRAWRPASLRIAWAAEFGHAISYPLAREASAEDLVRGLQP
jgi:hypothetical protein